MIFCDTDVQEILFGIEGMPYEIEITQVSLKKALLEKALLDCYLLEWTRVGGS